MVTKIRINNPTQRLHLLGELVWFPPLAELPSNSDGMSSPLPNWHFVIYEYADLRIRYSIEIKQTSTNRTMMNIIRLVGFSASPAIIAYRMPAPNIPKITAAE